MKHWKVMRGKPSIAFKRDTQVISIRIEEDKVVFTEGYASNFNVQMTKQEAIEALQEAIGWIERRRK
jgi:hypothetical protein